MRSPAAVAVAVVLALTAAALVRRPSPATRLARAGVGDVSASPSPVASDAALAFVARLRGALVRREQPSVQPFVDAWAERLRAGAAVDTALRDAIEDTPGAASLLPRTRAALSIGAEVDTALRADTVATRDDVARGTLSAVVACWSVAQRNGARLADALDRVAEGVRADELHRAHVRAQLAGPRATARLLAVLPFFALAMSSGLGLGAWHAMLSSTVGRCALTAGLALDGLGLGWTARLARRAERGA